MSISRLAQICEGEEARTVLVRAARAKVDELRTEYDRVRNLRTRLQQRGAAQAEINKAETAVHSVRIELTRARRELLRSI